MEQPDTAAAAPLAGVRVLDLSNLLAGPLLTMYLADFGADVIKVEHPVRGDEFRRWGHAKDDVALFFKLINRNKRMITLDLKSPRGQELCHSLARNVDVVVENYRPGTLERWGLGYEDLREHNPSLVMARISGFGQEGPYSSRAGFGTIAEAFSGYAAGTGHPDGPPLLPFFGLADTTTAIHGAYGIMVALYHCKVNGGAGQFLDLALYDGLFTLLGPHVIDYDQLGIVQERVGSRLPFAAPRNTYLTSDRRWLTIAGATQRTFERIAETLGIGHIVDDPDFVDNRARLKNVDKLDALIAAAVAKMPIDELLDTLVEAGAPVGPVNTVADLAADPHIAARESIVTVADEELGQVRMQNVVPRLSETPGRISHAAPPKGAHNKEIYGELLGLTDAEQAELAEQSVI